MTKKQTPHVVVTAIWSKASNAGCSPIRKQCHFVLAVNANQACRKVEKSLFEGRKVWIVRSVGAQYPDPIQKKINECFVKNGETL